MTNSKNIENIKSNLKAVSWSKTVPYFTIKKSKDQGSIAGFSISLLFLAFVMTFVIKDSISFF